MDPDDKQNPQVISKNQDNINKPTASTVRKAGKYYKYIAIFCGFVLFGIGGYFLGKQENNRQSQSNNGSISSIDPVSENQASPMPTASLQEETQKTIPVGWVYKENGECDVKIPVPPREEPYYFPFNPDEIPSVTEDIGSGRFWDFPRCMYNPNLLPLIRDTDNYGQSSTCFATEGGGSGYISMSVSVSCIPNMDGFNNHTALASMQDRVQHNNQQAVDPDDPWGIITQLSINENTRWNFPVLDISTEWNHNAPVNHPGISNNTYTLFTTDDFIYEVRIYGGSDNQFVIDTANTIFENLIFEN